MVNRKFLTRTFPLFIIVSVFIVAAANLTVANAQEIEYHLNHEWVKIWVNKDGTIDLLYDIEITCNQGVIHYVNIGQPNGDFTIGEAKDVEGHVLSASDVSSGNYYAVRVYLQNPIYTGQSARFTLLTNVGRMIWEDEDNPGNVGMQFIPCWWNADVDNLRVAVVLPKGVTTENVKCTPDWDNAYNDPEEDNKLVIYWERQNLSPNEKFSCGVSFPKEYVEHYETRGGWGIDWRIIGYTVLGILVVGTVSAGVVLRKKGYINPILRIETLGIRHGLTAVEASYLLGLSPTKIVTEILYSLLKKKAVWITASAPTLKLKIMKPFRDKTGTVDTPLRYYEKSFLRAVKRDGTLDEVKLAKTVMLLRDTVEGKLRGYCRRDTIAYYRKTVAKAWEEVERAGTPELASKAYDEKLLWLLLDEDFGNKTKSVFGDKIFEPEAGWWWYWYGYTYYHPSPTYKPFPKAAGSPPKIPGADFANTVVTAVEKTANNIVANLEKFANSIIPAEPPSQHTSKQPVHHNVSCVCACASCACVCACVSCACACASGGVG